MNNIIWNKDELKRMKTIILKKSNLKVNEDDELVQLYTSTTGNSFYHPSTSLYCSVNEELKNLFYTNDIEEINKVLSMASQVKADPDNKLHFGLINTLSKINPDNKEEIFIIFNEIVAMYESAIALESRLVANHLDNIFDTKKRIEDEINYNLSSDIKIKKYIEEILKFDNGITQSELFMPLIDKLNSLIKPRFVFKIKQLVANNIKRNESQKRNDFNSYKGDSILHLKRG